MGEYAGSNTQGKSDKANGANVSLAIDNLNIHIMPDMNGKVRCTCMGVMYVGKCPHCK